MYVESSTSYVVRVIAVEKVIIVCHYVVIIFRETERWKEEREKLCTELIVGVSY